MNKQKNSISEAAATYNVSYVDWETEQMRGSCSVRYCSAKKYNRTIIGSYLDSDPISVDSCKFQIKINKKEERVEIIVWESDADVDKKLIKAFDSFDRLYHDCCYAEEENYSFDEINLFSLIRNILEIDGGCYIPNCNYELFFDPDRIYTGVKEHEYWIDFTDMLAGDSEDRGYLGLVEEILNKNEEK